MLRNRVGAGHSARPVANCVIALSLAAAAACSGGPGGDDTGPSGFTGPGDFPSVVGRYQRQDQVAALTCSPETPPAGGDIATGAYQLFEPVRMNQSGSKVTLTHIDYPDQAPDTGTIDMAGKLNLGFKLSIKESKVRQGNRQFYVDIIASFAFDRLEDGAKWTGTGTFQNVFHEGSATAPVFATCTRSVQVQMTRVAE